MLVEGYTANIEVVRRTPSGKTTFQEQILFEFDGESPRVKHCQTISPFRSFNGNGRAMQIFDQIERLIRIKVGLPPRNMTRYCIL